MCKDAKLFGGEDTAGWQDLPAGCFSSWLRRIRYALIKDSEAVVQCGGCIACCKSSYFIHIRPDETRTLARIPKELLFAAPGLPKGNVLLGYDEQGRCPMLNEGKCSIYAYRPQTCRNYDCRIFAAAGITASDDDKSLIAQQVRRWKFSYPTKRDLAMHSAVKDAARFLREHVDCFPAGIVPSNSTQLAILTLIVCDAFFKYNNGSGKAEYPPDAELVQAIIEANDKFDAWCSI